MLKWSDLAKGLGFKKPSVIVFMSVLVYLFSYRFNVLFNPAYWDAIIGALHEAFWLYEHDFNYRELLFGQPGFWAGGPRVYEISCYPSIQALFYRWAGSPRMYLLLNHLFTFLLAAGAVSLLYQHIKSRSNHVWSALACLAFIIHPMFVSQASAINMEMGLLFLVLLSYTFFMHEKYGACALLLYLSYWYKNAAVIYALALAIVTILCVPGRKKFGWFLIYFFPVLFFLFHSIIRDKLFYQGGGEANFAFSSLTQITYYINFIRRAIALIPDIYISFWAVGIGSLILLLKQIVDGLKKPLPLQTVLFDLRPIALPGFLLSGSVLAIMLREEQFLPRYFFFLMPFLWMGAVRLLYHNCPRWGIYFFGIFIIMNLLNQKGWFYQQVSSAHLPNNGDVLERTREYEADMQLNQRLIEYVQDHHADEIIVTSWPFVHMLSIPMMGYVDKPLNVVSCERPVLQWQGVRTLQEIHQEAIPATNLVWLTVENAFFRKTRFNEKTDQLIKKFEIHDRVGYLFYRVK